MMLKRNIVYDKEFYAIVQALKKWRHYLFPFFYIYTNHQALQYFNSQGKLNERHLNGLSFCRVMLLF